MERHSWKWSRSVVSDTLWPHGLQTTRLLCPWDFSRQEYWSGMPSPSPGMHLNHFKNPSTPTPLSVEKSSSTKRVPGTTTEVGDHCSREKRNQDPSQRHAQSGVRWPGTPTVTAQTNWRTLGSAEAEAHRSRGGFQRREGVSEVRTPWDGVWGAGAVVQHVVTTHTEWRLWNQPRQYLCSKRRGLVQRRASSAASGKEPAC